MHVTVPLVLEYQEVLLRHRQGAGWSWRETLTFLGLLIGKAQRHKVYYLWRGHAEDPEDAHVLEAAVALGAEFLVTFSPGDLTKAAGLWWISSRRARSSAQSTHKTNQLPNSAMGALTVRLPDSLHEKVRDLAETEGISMNQLVMLAVSEKITRLDAEAQFAHLDALERFGKAVAEEEDVEPDELLGELLDRAGDAEPRSGENRPKRPE